MPYKGLRSLTQNLKSWGISVEHKTEEDKLVYHGQILLANNIFSRCDIVYRLIMREQNRNTKRFGRRQFYV